MAIGAIDSGKIQAMLSQLKAAAQNQPSTPSPIAGGLNGIVKPASAQTVNNQTKVDFSEALKASLDHVNNSQSKAVELGKSFAMGDDSVNLSDVMVASQKASISFQATVQVRNKLVSAYHDIMNMQI
jgi:flagellar hook-basal body complex protein FliE